MIEVPRINKIRINDWMLCLKYSHSVVDGVTCSLCISKQGNAKVRSLRATRLEFCFEDVSSALQTASSVLENVNNKNNGVAERSVHVIGTFDIPAADSDFDTLVPSIASPFFHIQYESPSLRFPQVLCLCLL